MLKLLEGLGKTANIYNAVRSGDSFEEDESDEESEAADDD